ncbi:MAG: carboxypeptidase-like regulatory domain-containing protein [Calditrichaeota bacterium]|nr:carboxypeptidase-like regulatory domain-containing protein [Calditrichota bacterium]
MHGCVSDAPHDNPLDIQNGKATFKIQGKVFTYYPPYKPVAGVFIFLKPTDQITVSGQNGEYAFSGLEAGAYTLICQAEGYAADSVRLNLSEKTTHDFFLDRLPYFKEIILRTHHLARWFPVEDIYYLELGVKAADPDGIGDLNAVYFQIPELNFTDTLQAGTDAGAFGKYLSENDLPVQKLAQLIGKQFTFIVKDDPGFSAVSDPEFLTRIIEQTPVLVSPVGLESVTSDTVTFRWQKVNLNYDFTYKIKLFQINLGVFTQIDEITGIPPSSASFSYETGLQAGEYFWRIYIVDEFGNTSGSKEGAFKIP